MLAQSNIECLSPRIRLSADRQIWWAWLHSVYLRPTIRQFLCVTCVWFFVGRCCEPSLKLVRRTKANARRASTEDFKKKKTNWTWHTQTRVRAREHAKSTLAKRMNTKKIKSFRSSIEWYANVKQPYNGHHVFCFCVKCTIQRPNEWDAVFLVWYNGRMNAQNVLAHRMGDKVEKNTAQKLKYIQQIP